MNARYRVLHDNLLLTHEGGPSVDAYARQDLARELASAVSLEKEAEIVRLRLALDDSDGAVYSETDTANVAQLVGLSRMAREKSATFGATRTSTPLAQRVFDEISAYRAKCAEQDAEIARLRRDAARWRAFRERVWVGTDEDAEIFIGLTGAEPDDCEWLTDTERQTFADGTIERSAMPDFADRFIDSAREAK